jgi:hypothetical protein
MLPVSISLLDECVQSAEDACERPTGETVDCGPEEKTHSALHMNRWTSDRSEIENFSNRVAKGDGDFILQTRRFPNALETTAGN